MAAKIPFGYLPRNEALRHNKFQCCLNQVNPIRQSTVNLAPETHLAFFLLSFLITIEQGISSAISSDIALKALSAGVSGFPQKGLYS